MNFNFNKFLRHSVDYNNIAAKFVSFEIRLDIRTTRIIDQGVLCVFYSQVISTQEFRFMRFRKINAFAS